jgi:hypothetical protein
MTWVRNPLSLVWVFLVVTTLVSWWLGAGGLVTAHVNEVDPDSFAVTLGIILIAALKVRFVFWHFMEVRHAPSWLRWACDSWLVFLVVVVLVLYRFSQ